MTYLLSLFLSFWLCVSPTEAKPPIEEFHELERGANLLSLDGGGVRGAALAVIIDQLERDAAKQIRTVLALKTSERAVVFDDPELTSQLSALLHRNAEVGTFLDGLIEQRVIRNEEGEEETIEIVQAHKMFGTIFGTSIGAITASGLSCPDLNQPGRAKFSGHDMKNFFLEDAPTIFPNFECSYLACCTKGCCGRTWRGPLRNTCLNMRHNCARDWTCNGCEFGDDSCFGLRCTQGWPGCCANTLCFVCCCGCLGCCQNYWGLTGPRYSAVPLKRVLAEKVGSTPMSASLTNLGLTVMDATDQRIKYFTSHAHGVHPIAGFAQASASAPTFLPGTEIPSFDGLYVDGGTGDNSPVLMGTIHTLQRYRELVNQLRPALHPPATEADHSHTSHSEPVVPAAGVGNLAAAIADVPEPAGRRVSITDTEHSHGGHTDESEIGAAGVQVEIRESVHSSVTPREAVMVDDAPEDAGQRGLPVDRNPLQEHPQEGSEIHREREAAGAMESDISPSQLPILLPETTLMDEAEVDERQADQPSLPEVSDRPDELTLSAVIEEVREAVGSESSRGQSLLKKIRVFSLGTGEIARKPKNHLKRSGLLGWVSTIVEMGMTSLGESNHEVLKQLVDFFRLQPLLPDRLENFTKASNVPEIIRVTKAYLEGEGEGQDKYTDMTTHLPGGKNYIKRLLKDL